MPTPTYTPLATVTLGSAAASVTFSSIPATYRDLILVVEGLVTADSSIKIAFNGDTTDSNYPCVFMRGTGSATDSGTVNRLISQFYSASRNNLICQIMDYPATDKHKTLLIRDQNPNVQTLARAMRWSNTSAVTSLVVSATSSTFVSSTTFNLYGIAS
jgi:hypothetical protein